MQQVVWSRSVALLLAVAICVGGWQLSSLAGVGQGFTFSWLSGALFGFLLQRSKFCFFCVIRDFVEQRRVDGVLGIVAALAVGTLGYHAILGSFLPDPSQGRLPPDAHVGPVSWLLALCAGLFGVGMSLSGSCVSAHLYRLGEGAVVCLIALMGVLAGFVLGFLAWNSLYLWVIQQAPVIWLPNHLGYGGSLLMQLALLAVLAAWLWRYRSADVQESSRYVGQSLYQLFFARRWPTWVGGVLIGALATVAYLRVGPLGVTAELGSWARTGGSEFNVLPQRLEGLDAFSGCATVIKQTLLSNNGLFIVALIFGSAASALASGDFKWQWPTLASALRNALGGVLIGLASMLALGCTVGTLLSGVMAGAVSGWVFAIFCVLGVLLGLPLRRALRLG